MSGEQIRLPLVVEQIFVSTTFSNPSLPRRSHQMARFIEQQTAVVDLVISLVDQMHDDDMSPFGPE